ncbi:hypothetical protein [Virgibacillus sp. Bac332]|nr:hypothetical protein [Virgibacillus sp. Bac332]
MLSSYIATALEDKITSMLEIASQPELNRKDIYEKNKEGYRGFIKNK